VPRAGGGVSSAKNGGLEKGEEGGGKGPGREGLKNDRGMEHKPYREGGEVRRRPEQEDSRKLRSNVRRPSRMSRLH